MVRSTKLAIQLQNSHGIGDPAVEEARKRRFSRGRGDSAVEEAIQPWKRRFCSRKIKEVVVKVGEVLLVSGSYFGHGHSVYQETVDAA
jgi:hypothetical protein